MYRPRNVLTPVLETFRFVWQSSKIPKAACFSPSDPGVMASVLCADVYCIDVGKARFELNFRTVVDVAD